MAYRPSEHVAEEVSRRAFEAAIPANWVVRPMSPDYGYDLQVQPFIDGASTSLFFMVQLKGTDGKGPDTGPLRKRVKTERLREYLRCPNPVLLVAHSGDRLCYRWVSEWHDNADLATRLSLGCCETMTVPVATPVGPNFVQAILDDLKSWYRASGMPSHAALGLRCRLVLTGFPESISSSVKGRFADWVRGDPAIHLVQNQPHATIGIAAGGTAWISFRGLAFKMTLNQDARQSPDWALRALQSGACLVFQKAGLTTVWRRLAASFLSETAPELIEGPLFPLLVGYAVDRATEDRGSEAVDLAELLLQRGLRRGPAILAEAAAQSTKAKLFAPRAWAVLSQIIAQESVLITRAKYKQALAHSLWKSGHQTRQAASMLFDAAIDDPHLLDSGFWWRSVAGCLTLSGRHRLALRIADYARTFDDDDANGLCGDICIELGRFRSASEYFTSALRRPDVRRPAFLLRLWLANELSRIYGPVARRRPLAAHRVAEQARGASPEKKSELLEASLRLDCLSVSANLQLALAANPVSNTRWEFLWLRVVEASHDSPANWWALAVWSIDRIAAGDPEIASIRDAAIVLGALYHSDRFFEAYASVLRTSLTEIETAKAVRLLRKAQKRASKNLMAGVTTIHPI